MKESSFIEMRNQEDHKKTDFRTYQRPMGKLIYLLYNTRLDIIFVIEQLSRHNANPRKDHF